MQLHQESSYLSAFGFIDNCRFDAVYVKRFKNFSTNNINIAI